MKSSILRISDLHRDPENPTGNEALRAVRFVGAHCAITELNRRVTESIRKRHNIGDSTNGSREGNESVTSPLVSITEQPIFDRQCSRLTKL
jgi:hypothetical protein